MYACGYVHMSGHAHRSQRHQIPPGSGVTGSVSWPLWVRGTKFWSSARAVHSFNPWTISLAPILLIKTYFLSTIWISLGFSPGDSISVKGAFVKLPELGRKNQTKHEQGSWGCYCKSITQLSCPLTHRELVLPKTHVKVGVISSDEYEGKTGPSHSDIWAGNIHPYLWLLNDSITASSHGLKYPSPSL